MWWRRWWYRRRELVSWTWHCKICLLMAESYLFGFPRIVMQQCGDDQVVSQRPREEDTKNEKKKN